MLLLQVGGRSVGHVDDGLAADAACQEVVDRFAHGAEWWHGVGVHRGAHEAGLDQVDQLGESGAGLRRDEEGEPTPGEGGTDPGA
jgi:hypothetical protein